MVNVTGLSTGHIVIADYDSNGNIAHSVPMLIRISDVKPPQTPTGLKALVSPTGRVTLRWQPSPDNDIMEYSIWKANALDHVFGRISPTDMRDTLFVDSISVRANQKYIYYKVMATDFSGNSSELSEAVAVPIPDLTRPQFCRADSIYMDEDCIRIWWVGSPEASVKTHRVLRRLKGQEQWTLLAIVDADSLGPDHRFLMEDRPPYVQDRRYYYACETISRMGVSSGLSLQQSFLFRGPQILDVDLRLMATYDKRSGETRLAWETGGIPTEADCYYAIYRKAKGQPEFKFLTSVKRDTSTHTDYLQRPGVEADYYVKIIFRDGRQSKPSNTVTVKGARN
jgi:fibronectin type 3 domain-containing protein